MIQQILYNCEADCTVLIRKPHVISGEGARHLRPPRRSAPGYNNKSYPDLQQRLLTITIFYVYIYNACLLPKQ